MPGQKNKMAKKGKNRKLTIAINAQRLKELLAIHDDNEVTPWRILKIQSEFVQGFDFISRYKNTISIFGTARCSLKSKLYQKAYRLAYNLSKSGYTIVTGGGPGIMEAANHGAYDAGGQSVGLDIQLPQEQRINKYVKESESFHYFFTRKMMLSFAAQAYIFFPGGFGTLDEFFEMVTMVQTKKVKPLPIVLVHIKYWAPLLKWLDSDVYKKFQAVSPQDLKLFHLVDGAREAAALVKKRVKKGK
ncbi:MAG: TIGR00730 family Rossman fold protein [Patescibacteria group bacterium]